eukprot:12900447-Prorocentrum_lima.AAC.1
MSDTTVDSDTIIEVRMEEDKGVLLRPLHLRALQWSCRAIAIQTNEAGGTTHFRAAMADVEELIVQHPISRRERAPHVHGVVLEH